ncbi:Na+ dependent nucleoside transporter C-terminus-domain-containing protein [Stachybotrys elegans]|uniref:Na+ dependent nucleoside transporter C-terminus-domain-containing protein n=1 Tax=Stachybotrys elegans TaxID=80388 RepID=A0A8K0SNV6_9HYPO|nr:Na+ dependent nucleoside transporter C-terminus-domain-containing protein [Stachybotrys elegans]
MADTTNTTTTTTTTTNNVVSSTSTPVPEVGAPHVHQNEKIVEQPLATDNDATSRVTPPEYSDNDKKGGLVRSSADAEEARPEDVETAPPSPWKRRLGPVYTYRRPLIHAFVAALFTGWWIASLVVHHHDRNWTVPFLLWLGIMLRLITYYVPARYVAQGIRFVWKHTAVLVVNAIPQKFRLACGALGAIATVLVGTFASDEMDSNTNENRAVSLFGLVVILFAFWATSANRSRINWQTVIVGMLAQYIIGLFVLRTDAGYDIFRWIADRAGNLLGYARDGSAFLVGPDTANTLNFFWSVIPAIVFFISICQVLFHIGFLQWFVGKFATFVYWALGVSGAEAVVAAATPFIGQGESAMLVRPFVPYMTKAEIHQIMTCGFATISGSVLVGYIGLGLPPAILVSSCIMSIPASLAISKLRYPETEETLTAGRVVIPDDDEHKAENALHAFANGAWLGIKIAGTIIASLLCIIALVALLNGLMSWWGRYININDPHPLTLQLILGYVFYPVSFLLGIRREDNELLLVGRVIAEKIITNEYNAFTMLAAEVARIAAQNAAYIALDPRTQLIAAYAICGFGNIGSLGIQIGILGQLAPGRGGDVSRLAFSALISGVFSTLSSAAVAGLVVTTQRAEFPGVTA